PALKWLGRDQAVESAIEAMVAAATAGPDAPKLLRARLAGARGGLSLGEGAKAAGGSRRRPPGKMRAPHPPRAGGGTRAAGQCAQQMLADTDEKITSIALEVGCASLQHFSTLFRKATGVSPKEWRERARRS